jgi:hypothetical protein
LFLTCQMWLPASRKENFGLAKVFNDRYAFRSRRKQEIHFEKNDLKPNQRTENCQINHIYSETIHVCLGVIAWSSLSRLNLWSNV